jgi:hypothetical protein
VIAQTENSVTLVEAATQELLDWAAAITESDRTYFEKAKALASRLGSHYRREDGLTEIGFWTPELTGEALEMMEVRLEVLTPLDPIDWRCGTSQVVRFQRDRVALKPHREYLWGVLSGMRPGSRDRAGSFYWLRYLDAQNRPQTVRDVVATSLPFGIFAPAELYDTASLQENRADLDYLATSGSTQAESHSLPRTHPPSNILQIYLGTASEAGTVEGLTKIYQQIATKLQNQQELNAAETNFIGYDAVQLLPVEPTIEYGSDRHQDENSEENEIDSEFFTFLTPSEADLPSSEDLELLDVATVQLQRPNTQNWGFDVPILGGSTINPAFLETLRPDEMVDLIATLHNFPTGPIQVIFDVVFSHADDQAELCLNRQFLKGGNSYGQELNHQLPTVRAIFQEILRRKVNFGIDGIRLDRAHEYQFFNPLSGRMEQDDAFLLEMSDVVQEINGYRRHLCTIFEDARPWPDEGWEQVATYRDLIEQKPGSYQWSPLIFGNNAPMLYSFWQEYEKRIDEVIHHGERWVVGCGNHDTLRRAHQIDPEISTDIDWHLGDDLRSVFLNAYDNPAVNTWLYAFSPGLPMDFLHATMRSPWMFFRNTDRRYGVLVVSEEVGFLYWHLTPQLYDDEKAFPRVKSLGFTKLADLRKFCMSLRRGVLEREYDLDEIVAACKQCLDPDNMDCDLPSLGPLEDENSIAFVRYINSDRLKEFARRFLEDAYEFCNVWRYANQLDSKQTHFNLQLRKFRQQNHWLQYNLKSRDRFHRVSDDRRIVFYGKRHNPDNPQEEIVMLAHIWGDPMMVSLGDWLQLDLSEWQSAIVSPSLAEDDRLKDLRYLELRNSEALVLKVK